MHAQVHVGWMEDGKVVFAFRGTATVQDGLADLKILRKDVYFLQDVFPGTRAHHRCAACKLALGLPMLHLMCHPWEAASSPVHWSVCRKSYLVAAHRCASQQTHSCKHACAQSRKLHMLFMP